MPDLLWVCDDRGMTRAESAGGRPRSADATQAVLEGALRLAYEGGIGAVTVERIVQETGAKTTIYRRWSNAASVVMEAFLAEIQPFIAYQPRPTAEEAFRHALTRLVKALEGSRGELLRQLLGAAQKDPALQQAFWEHWIRPRREAALQVLAQAAARGEIDPAADHDVLVDTLFGAVYYRLMIPYASLTPGFARTVVRQVFAGARPPAASAG
jgi:AcrR family transcriptional regulator